MNLSLESSQKTQSVTESANEMTRAFQREALLTPWVSACKYQNEVADLWRIGLNACQSFFAASTSTAASASRERTASPSRQIENSREAEKPQDDFQATTNPTSPETNLKTEQTPGESKAEEPQGASPPEKIKRHEAIKIHTKKKHAVRHPAEATKKERPKQQERTVKSVIEGLQDRSYTVKSAAVAAMTANKKFRTPKAIPLLKRIVESKTIHRRKPELQKAALTVLHRSQQEGHRQHVHAVAKRSPSKSKTRSKRK